MLTSPFQPPGAGYPPGGATRDELIELGLPIVRRMAFRMARRLPPSVDVGDLIGAGTEGLLKAADAFDPARHPRFEPYAEARIRGAILDELRGLDPMTRHGRRRLAEVSKAIRKLEMKLGRQPEEDEIAEALGLGLEQYQKLAEELARAPALAAMGDTDPDGIVADGMDPTSRLDEEELVARVARAVEKLPPRTQTVLALYYQEECTQAEIAEVLGVTESRVCQILGESTARLRATLEKEEKRDLAPRAPRRRTRDADRSGVRSAPVDEGGAGG